MTALLALALVHVVGALVWGAVIAILGLVLLAARRDDEAALRALPEVADLSRRALRPAILLTTLSGLVLATRGGFVGEAWVVLSTLLALGTLVAETCVIRPDCLRAKGMPRGAALHRGRQALRLAEVSLGAQASAIALVVLTPSWSGAAILAGLVACLVMAVALVRQAEAGDSTLASSEGAIS